MVNFSKSPWVIHYDGSSCNGCDIEVLACLMPRYDVERFGIINTGNPKHADVFLVTGSVNEQNKEVVKQIYDQMIEPKIVVAVGICACTGGVFKECYNILGGVDTVIPVDVYVPGCAARPEAIIEGVVEGLAVLDNKAKNGINTKSSNKEQGNNSKVNDANTNDKKNKKIDAATSNISNETVVNETVVNENSDVETVPTEEVNVESTGAEFKTEEIAEKVNTIFKENEELQSENKMDSGESYNANSAAEGNGDVSIGASPETAGVNNNDSKIIKTVTLKKKIVGEDGTKKEITKETTEIKNTKDGTITTKINETIVDKSQATDNASNQENQNANSNENTDSDNFVEMVNDVNSNGSGSSN